MKKILFFATALLALASCTSDDFLGESPRPTENATISFGFDVPTPTRSSGAVAASALGNQFIVWGEKNEANYAAGDVVFKNYIVNWTDNTAYTTTSNTKNWEYVGITSTYGDNVLSNNGGVAQTIKYWDYGASNYVFTAVSAKQDDISAGDVIIEKIDASNANYGWYGKGYTLTLTGDADPSKIYIADRVRIEQGTGTDREAPNAYGGHVTFTFRNLLSQIRVAMYETIPGYTVKIDKFYYVNNANPTFATMGTEGTDMFYANVPNVLTTSGATLTVRYNGSNTAIENQPTVSVGGAATVNNYLAIGDGTNLKASTVLGDSKTGATFDYSTKAFTQVFPQEANNKNLKLKVDYTLTASDTGEEIKVTGATAEIPFEYLQWKPNFKYTYYFKISDNTNGSTGGGVTGLYPITFDALVVVAEDGTAEYITTVSEPSITTFGVDATSGKYVTDGSDYANGKDIYATIMDNSAVVTPELGTNVNVYKVVDTSADDAFVISEAAVAETLAETANAGSHKITATNINADASTNFTAAPDEVTTVPGEDGVDITINALKLTGVKAGTYAIEYVKTARVYTYTAVASGTPLIAGNTYYTTADDATTAFTANGSEDSSTTTYYTRAITTPGVYVYKIVIVK